MNQYLFVCTANMLRSPTAEHVARSLGFTADSAGISPEHAVRLLSLESIERAERIVCFEMQHQDRILEIAPHRAEDVQLWYVPDRYNYCQQELVSILLKRLEGDLREKSYAYR